MLNANKKQSNQALPVTEHIFNFGQNMKGLMPVAFICVCAVLSACVLGWIQHLPEIHMACTVLDSASRKPIAGARVCINRSGFDERQKFGPFITDAEGKTVAAAPSKVIRISGSEAYVGGYITRIDVDVAGRKTWSLYLKTEEKIPAEYTFLIPNK